MSDPSLEAAFARAFSLSGPMDRLANAMHRAYKEETASERTDGAAPDPLGPERLAAAFRASLDAGPDGHQATPAERAAAYRQFAQARERLYGRPPESEGLRNSLSPASASPMVRRLFGG